MWAFILRRVLYNIPVFLIIILVMMAMLRVQDPVRAYTGKNVSEEQIERIRQEFGLDKPFVVQYWIFMSDALGIGEETPFLDFGESWAYPGSTVREKLLTAFPASMSITVPTLICTSVISICIGLVSAFFRGRSLDRGLVIAAVLGMSISYLVYVILGQYFLAYLPRNLGWEFQPFAISGYEPWTEWGSFELFGLSVPYPTSVNPKTWMTYCMLPVIVGVTVGMGYDTRFYRAVMVEECNRDYITTAQAKGAPKSKIMFVHMLKNAMIPIITRIMITLPFLVTGSIVLEMYFNIPGMGKMLIDSIISKDYPMVQGFTAVIAFLYIGSIILTDVLYAVVDPRIRLS
ncbi:MAG: ABC transporter permease [Phycisphaerales bacterium]